MWDFAALKICDGAFFYFDSQNLLYLLAMKIRILFVLPILCVATCQLISEEDYPSDWINPADMMNFVPVTRTAGGKKSENQQHEPVP